MDDYLYAGALGNAFKGAIEAWQNQEDRNNRKLEMQARIEAEKSQRERQQFMDQLTMRDKGMMKNEAGQVVPDVGARRSAAIERLASSGLEPEFDDQANVTGTHYRPEYLRMKSREAIANKPTPGETTVDKEFGKEYADYFAGGGRATVEKNLGLFQEAINDMKARPNLTGGLSTKVGLSGDAAQDVINPELAAVRDKIRSAIQGSLRVVLGPQFTEKEGAAIFSRAFNPRLSTDENIARATRELKTLQQMADAKQASADYYEKRGTLKGYKASQEPGLLQARPGMLKPKPGLIEQMIPKAEAGAPAAKAPKAGTVEDGYRFKGGNPADPKNWEKVR